MCNFSSRGEKKTGEDIIFEDIVGWQYSIFGENYKPTDPRSLLKLKLSKYEETRAHHN